MSALVLDLRLVMRQHVLGVIAVIVVVGCAVTGSLTLAWPIAAAWVVMCGHSHRDLEPLGRTGALQSVLGISRRRAVQARYAQVVLIAAGMAVLGVVTAGFWSALGRDLAPVWGYVGVLAFALAFGLINLMLGYVASPGVRQVVGVTMVLVTIGIAVIPNLTAPEADWSTDALVDALYAGPVPVVLLAVLAALVTLVIGSRSAVQAHERAVL